MRKYLMLLFILCFSDMLFANKNETLFDAIKRSDLKSVKAIIASRADIYPRDSDGNAPLHIAISKGDSSIFEFIIRKGASTRSKNDLGNPPI